MKQLDAEASCTVTMQQTISAFEKLRLRTSAWAMKMLLKYFPGDSILLARLGSVELILGNYDEADHRFKLSLDINSDQPYIHFMRGNTLQELGRNKDALACYKRAISLHSGFEEALACRDALLQRLQETVRTPTKDSHHSNKMKAREAVSNYKNGEKFYKQGKFDEALTRYDRAIALNPDYAEAHFSRGIVLQQLHRLDDALASLDRGISINPDYATGYFNRGSVLYGLHKLNDALESTDRAIAIDPDYADAHSNRGVFLLLLNRWDEALASLDRAIALKPGDMDPYVNRGSLLIDLGRWEEARSSLVRAIELNPDSVVAYDNLLFLMNFDEKCKPEEQLEQARHYGAIVSRTAKAYTQWRVGTGGHHCKQLKIGFVSGDFRHHPVGLFLDAVAANIDASRLQLVAYSTTTKEDALTASIKSRFAAWKVIEGLDDQAAAERIHADGIHILIDLAGHTQHNRLPVFGWKPAPIQASWLGYCATTGVSEIDYYIADNCTLPASVAGQFSEIIWRLPEFYLSLAPPSPDIAVATLPALSAGYITFGSFNNLSKMTETVVASWSRILKAIPGSKLFLKSAQLNSDSMRDGVMTQFAAHGITIDRLKFGGHIADQREHLAAYGKIDIGLDPFPYNGVTTTFEALWMGVPVLTLAGDRFLSRQGAGILSNAGLSDWIARDEDELVAKAVAFAGDINRLASLRTDLRKQVQVSPLFDTARFARNLEDAFFNMWHKTT